jgi:hypothetical protein
MSSTALFHIGAFVAGVGFGRDVCLVRDADLVRSIAVALSVKTEGQP